MTLSDRKGLGWVRRTALHKHVQHMKTMPSAVFSLNLFFSTWIIALSASPKGWDEGSAASIFQLPSFLKTFHLSTTGSAGAIGNLVSFVNLGATAGALLTIFIGDHVGRISAQRIIMLVYAAGIFMEAFSQGNIGILYGGRIIAGLGIGAGTVFGPMHLAEIAPKEIRGLLGLCFTVTMTFSQVIGTLSVYAVSLHLPKDKNIQWMTPYLAQLAVPVVTGIGGFFVTESPRWLMAKGREADAEKTLCKLRRLEPSHPYIIEEMSSMRDQVEREQAAHLTATGPLGKLKEVFTVRNYRRRVAVVVIVYALAQMSGANAITNYLPTIFGLVGVKGTKDKLITSAMYSLAKTVFGALAALILIDGLGRRKSLFTGITIQGLCHIYLGSFLKVDKDRNGVMPEGSSIVAIGAIYLHALGWSMGLFPLPYLFGGELFPTHVRAVGGALSQGFHWLFYFAITKATPSLLSSTHNFGAFFLFASFCFIAGIYGYLAVPETSERTLEDIDKLFDQPWYRMNRTADEQQKEAERRAAILGVPSALENGGKLRSEESQDDGTEAKKGEIDNVDYRTQTPESHK